jgi:hypothetical protein
LKETLSAQKAVDVATDITKRIFDLGEDFDGDGLTDCEESNGILVVDPKSPEGTFVTETSNPENRDEDLDGLIDGLEFKRFEPKNKKGARVVKLAMETYLRTPVVRLSLTNGGSAKNSDGDHLNDYEEYLHGTNALVADKKGSEGVWLKGKSLVDHYLTRWECDESLFGIGGRKCTFAEREKKLRSRFIKDLKGYSAFEPEMQTWPIENLATMVLRLTVAEVDVRTGSGGIETLGTLSREDRKEGWTATFVLKDVIDPVRAAKSLEKIANFLLPIGVGLLVIAAAIVIGPAVLRAGGTVARAVFQAAKDQVAVNGGQGVALWVFRLTKIPVGFSLSALTLGSIGCSVACPSEVDDAIDTITGNAPDIDSIVRKYDDEVLGVIRRLDGDDLSTDLIKKIEFDNRKVIVPGPAEFDVNAVDRFGNSNGNRIAAEETPLDLNGRPLLPSQLDDSTVALVPLEASAALRGCATKVAASSVGQGGFGRFSILAQVPAGSSCKAGVKTPAIAKIPRGNTVVSNGLNTFIRQIYLQVSNTTMRLWSLGPFARGYIIEAFLCPDRYGRSLTYAFKTMDCVLRDSGGAILEMTNIKSINLRSRTYSDPKRLKARLDSILARTKAFESYNNVALPVGGIRRIHIAIPPGGTSPKLQQVLDDFVAKSTDDVKIVVEKIGF